MFLRPQWIHNEAISIHNFIIGTGSYLMPSKVTYIQLTDYSGSQIVIQSYFKSNNNPYILAYNCFEYHLKLI